MLAGRMTDTPPATSLSKYFRRHLTIPTTYPPLPRRSDMQKHNVYNLTIRQILTANRVPEEQFYEVDGQTVSSVAFVGEVTHVDPKATAVVFTVEDTTGKMTCKKWNNSSNANSGEIDAGAESDPNIVVGRIVRVHGNLKSFNDQPQLSVYAVKDLNNDANAITHHHLQSVYEHLQRTKGPLGRAGPGGAGVNTPAKGIYGQGPGNVVVKQQTGPAVTSGDVGDLRSAIMTYINRVGADAGDEGVSIDAVQQNVAAARSLPKSKVADELQALCDDGALYTTVDDSHFASTE